MYMCVVINICIHFVFDLTGIFGKGLEDTRRKLEELANGSGRRKGARNVKHRQPEETRRRSRRKDSTAGRHQQPECRRHQHLHRQSHYLQRKV